MSNELANYWTSAGPYDEIYYYIENNIAAVRDDLAVMVSGASVPAKVLEYAATTMKLQTKNEIFSAMVVYGFLSYENGKVSIPNKDQYRVEREDKAGIGYVDFIFYPEMDRNADCIILELKVDHTPEEAIEQIKRRCKVEVLNRID